MPSGDREFVERREADKGELGDEFTQNPHSYGVRS